MRTLKIVVLVFSVFTLLFSTNSSSKAKKDFEAKILKKLEEEKIDDAEKLMEEWKKENGEQEVQYWVMESNILLRTALQSYVAVEGTSKDGKKPEGNSFSINDPKTGKQVGTLSEKKTIDTDKIKQAATSLDKAIKVAPNRLDIYTGRAYLHRTNGDVVNELAALKSLVTDPKPIEDKYLTGKDKPLDGTLGNYQVDMLNMYASEHFKKETPKDDDTGIKIAQMLIKYFPKKTQGYNLMAASESYKKNWKGSFKWLDQASKVDPEDSLVMFNKGYTLRQLKRNKEADECFKKVLDIGNNMDLVTAARKELKMDSLIKE